MKLRVARHTQDLESIRQFYTHILGLVELGGFENHQGYDGLFLGQTGENWHLEFTVSEQLPNHLTDEDDILVFYVSAKQLKAIKERAREGNVKQVQAKNPYWDTNGFIILDPDGFRIAIALQG